MGVLHVEDRVLARLRHRGVEVEIHLRVGFAHQHEEAHRIRPDLVDQVAQFHERARALAHAHRLAILHHPHDLAQHHVQPRQAVAGERLHRRDHALDIAAMVGAPDIDHVVKAARHLVGMIGDVVGEIGPAAVGFLHRPVHVVAEGGGAEQHLLARLPIVGHLALGRLQHAAIDQPLLFQIVDRRLDAAGSDHRALRGEHVMPHAQRRQVLADHVQHFFNGEVAEQVQPRRPRAHRRSGRHAPSAKAAPIGSR